MKKEFTTVAELQWAMSRLDSVNRVFSQDLAEAINLVRYLVDVIVTRADISGDTPAAEIIPKIESLIFQARENA
jgi:hypothetical protein